MSITSNIPKLAESAAGVLLGVSIVKAGTGLLPANIGDDPTMRSAAAAPITIAIHQLAHNALPTAVADGLLLSGIAQTLSIALDAYWPTVGATIGLQGLGDLVGPASFAVPENPLWLAAHVTPPETAALGRVRRPAPPPVPR